MPAGVARASQRWPTDRRSIVTIVNEDTFVQEVRDRVRRERRLSTIEDQIRSLTMERDILHRLVAEMEPRCSA